MRRISVLAILILLIIGPELTLAHENEYSVGDSVIVTAPTETIWSKPSSSSEVVATVSKADELIVIASPATRANGIDWWNLRTTGDALEGWIPGLSIRLRRACEGLADYQSAWTNALETDANLHPTSASAPRRPPPLATATTSTTQPHWKPGNIRARPHAQSSFPGRSRPRRFISTRPRPQQHS